MIEAVYLAMDVETTGLRPSTHSLLTGALFALDEKFDELDRMTFALKHEVYRVAPRAMAINNIDLVAHEKIAEDATSVRCRIGNFLLANTNVNAETGKRKRLMPLGKNVHFDTGWFQDLCGSTWDEFVGYSNFDLSTLAHAAEIVGHLPKGADLSLVGLAKHFGFEHRAHTADGDVEATIACTKKILYMLQGDFANDPLALFGMGNRS